MLTQAISKNAIGLAIFAIFTAGIIAVTQLATKDTIEQNKLEFQLATLKEILPLELQNDGLVDQILVLTKENTKEFGLLGRDGPIEAYYATDSAGINTLIMPISTPDGYTGNIDILVAINRHGELLGVRVTDHKETPGLGDQIEIGKSDWVLGFNGKSRSNPDEQGWKVKKDGGDFDQMTGATITPRAIVGAVKRALDFFELNKARLLQQ